VQQGLTVTCDARWGRPLHRGILRKVVDSQPLLVAKDTHYHDVLKRTLLSNTDWSLIRSCPSPLLLVKPRTLGSPPKMLAAVDPTHEHDKPANLDRAIVAFAREFANKIGSPLHVLHAFDTAPVLAAASATTPVAMATVPVTELITQLEREHREALQALLSDVPIDPSMVHLAEGAPAQCLARFATEQDIDFVVMGAVSRSGLQRLFVGSTAEFALDRLPLASRRRPCRGLRSPPQNGPPFLHSRRNRPHLDVPGRLPGASRIVRIARSPRGHVTSFQ
jgi:universal stress protein E